MSWNDWPHVRGTGRQVPWNTHKTAEDIITRERRALDALDDIRGNR